MRAAAVQIERRALLRSEDLMTAAFKRLMPAAMMGILSAAMLAGCSSQAAPAPQRTARPANRYIYVTAQNLPGECYSNLGGVKITQSFGDATVDQDQSEAAKELRAQALQSYPNDVDAVINVQSQQNDVGTEVTVSGDAVRLEDHPTVQCALRGSKGAMDTAAVMAAGGIAGAAAGGLVSGAAAATSLGIAGASAMGVRAAMQHENANAQQQEEFRQALAAQRKEITQLLNERSQLRRCQQEELTLKACLALPPPPLSASSKDETAPDSVDRDTVNATPFQMESHLQQEQDYIKQLKDEVAQIKWQMSSH
jgi:hypothetical protein